MDVEFITFEEFLQKELRYLNSFGVYWREMNQKDPDNFPNEMLHGDWNEQKLSMNTYE